MGVGRMRAGPLLAAAALLCSTVIPVTDAPAQEVAGLIDDFRALPASTRTGIRYWFLTDNASDAQIRREIEDIAAAGFGRIEICNKSGTLETAAWARMMETVVQAAEQHGLYVSFTFYNDGPSSVPVEYLRDGGSSMQLVSGYTELTDDDFDRVGDRLVYKGEIPAVASQEGGFGGGPGGPPPGGPAPAGPAAGSPAAGGPPPGGAPAGPPGGGPAPGNPGGQSGGARELVAVTVARKTGGMHEDAGSTWSFTGERTDYTIPVIELDKASLEVVALRDDTSVDWSLPAAAEPSEYVIFSFYSQSSLAPGAAGGGKAVVDHFSTRGAAAMFAFYEDTVFANDVIRDYFARHGGSMFEDSLELMGSPVWTTNLLQEFATRRAYDLTDMLPVLVNRFYMNLFSQPAEGDIRFGFADRSDRLIANDVNELLDTLYQEYHLKPIRQWVNDRGMSYRAQAYNGRETGHHDTIQNAAFVDIIEGESLAMMEIHDGYDSFRYLAGGAHIAGKQLVSDELAAVMGGAYNITVADVVDILNKNAAGGANRFLLHGYPSQQDSGQEWPGYHAFGSMFTDPWEDRQPVWQDVRLMTDYMSRTETVLQAGKAKLDLAVYRDLKYVKMPYIDGDELTSRGYSYEYLSPEVLGSGLAVVSGGRLAAGGAAYKAMVIYEQAAMTPETAGVLQDFADAGLPLIFVGQVPGEVPYYFDAETERATLADRMTALLATDGVYRVESIGQLAEVLGEIDVVPAAVLTEASQALVLHRQVGSADVYWFYNPSGAAETMALTLQGTGAPYSLDPWTGSIEAIARYSGSDTGIALNIRLPAASTVIVALSDEAIAVHPDRHVIEGGAHAYLYDSSGSVIARSGGGEIRTTMSDGREFRMDVAAPPARMSLTDHPWTLVVESWSKDENDPNGMRKVETVRDLGRLVDWTGIEDLQTVSGRARYETSFELNDWTPDTGAYLQFQTGDGTAAITRVAVNGNTLEAPDQSAPILDAGEFLVPGKNTVTIELATVLYNTVFETPRYAYGLTDVQLIPYTDVALPE